MRGDHAGLGEGLTDAEADEYNGAALAAVACTLESNTAEPAAPRPAAILHDQAVWVTAPARVDMAGGWSDTPPICWERGVSSAMSAQRERINR